MIVADAVQKEVRLQGYHARIETLNASRILCTVCPQGHELRLWTCMLRMPEAFLYSFFKIRRGAVSGRSRSVASCKVAEQPYHLGRRVFVGVKPRRERMRMRTRIVRVPRPGESHVEQLRSEVVII